MTRASADRSKFVPGRPGDYQRIHPRSEVPYVTQAVSAEVGGANTSSWRADRNWRTGAGYAPPTGLSAEQHVSWLAWEALRRNVRFQKFCRTIADSNDDDSGWSGGPTSSDWGLATYKCFDAAIELDDPSTWPQWIALEPARIVELVHEREVGRPNARNRTERPDRGAKRWLSIQGGQVAVVFDLARITCFKPILKRQLKQAHVELTRMLDDLESTINPRDAVQTPQLGSIIPLLRIADAMFDEPAMSREAIGAVVFDESLEPSKEMVKQVKKAVGLIYREGYMALLAKG